ncbi:MAG: calcium-binding protein [Paracoccaceae bacterium]
MATGDGPRAGSGAPIVGGLGAQTLTGSDGDDLIYADLAPGEAGDRLRPLERLRDGGEAAEGPAHVTGVLHEGAARFYAAGAARGAGGAGGWSVGGDDRLVPVWSQSAMFYDADDMLTGAPAILAFDWDGARWLATGGLGVSLARLDDGGVPEPLETAPAVHGAGLMHPGAFAWFERDGLLHLLVGGGWDGGLSVLRFDPFGLTLAARVDEAPGLPLADVSDLAVLEVGGRRFAAATSRRDGALGIWTLDEATPRPVDMRGLGDGESGFDLVGAAAVEVLRHAGAVWLWAASEGRTVGYRVAADGTLERIGSEAGATALASVRIGGRDHLVSAEVGGDLVVRVVGAGGRLEEMERHALGPEAEVTGLAAVATGDRALLTLSRADAAGHDLIALRPEGNDRVDGGGGDDEIHGGPGDDTLLGGEGDDTLLGETGDDALEGGPGADVLVGGEGADTLSGGGGADRLEGGSGDDLLVGGGGRDRLFGGGGRDRLEGGGGRDRLEGGGGDDSLYGGGGRDTLDGAGGRDALHGGAGRDRLFGGGGRDTLEGGGGRDRLDGGAGHDRLDGGGGKDRLIGGPGRDTLEAGRGRDRLEGGGGRDLLEGGGGGDRLEGGGGHDRLNGGGGRDRLDGGPGRDRLSGGAGRDLLEGGAGRDVFVFGPREGRDRIEDFGRGRDRIAFDSEGRFEDLRIKAKGGDALLIFEGTKVLLEGVSAGRLDADDFLFG